MATALINPKMLSWAIHRSGISVPELACKLNVREDKVSQWESGEKLPTFKQAQNFAHKTHVPFGYLFMPTPPKDDLPLPDLRTVGGAYPNEPSAELLDIVKIVLQRQEWYREYLLDNFVEENPVVARFSVQSKVNDIVQDIRQALGVGAHPTRGKWDEYYRDLTNRIESNGILVMRESNLGHWTRPLNVDEFRGFAIADKLAPVIFVNHADAPGPRLFTLLHELTHIWLGKSGISDNDPGNSRTEEVLCNAVAAEFLVPEDEFMDLWDDDTEDWRDNLPLLEKHFHVSTWVIARRALTLGKINIQEYRRYIAAQRAAYQAREKSDTGPDYYKTKHAQHSTNFSKAVVREALAGKLLLRDAGNLLGIKPNKITQFAKELGV